MPTAEQDMLSQILKKRDLKQFFLSEEEGKIFLRSIKINTPEGSIVTRIDQAINAARHIGFPIVIKGLIENITHKSDYGLVKAGVPVFRDLADALLSIGRVVQYGARFK